MLRPSAEIYLSMRIGFKMDQIIRSLIERLTGKGMEISIIPAYIRDLANITVGNGYLSLPELNRQLQLLGWDDFELDDSTFHLLMSIFEIDGLISLEHGKYLWLKRTFNPDKTF